MSHPVGTVVAVELLDGLTPAQLQAVVSPSAPLCILAGAGAGKTRVLTRRIAYRVATGSADAGHVLALTFTRRAAGELATRLRRLGVRDRVTAGTFHAVAYAELRRRWADRHEAAPALLDRKGRLLGSLLAGRAVGHADVQVGELAAEIEWAQARLVAPGDYARLAQAAGRRPPLPAEAMGALYARYESEKRRRGLVDFDDLLLRLVAAMESDASFAAAQRWRWRHIFVDEFQDVNPLQHRLLLTWLGDRTDLCVVGDPNQAIYAWNGADPRLLAGFRAAHPTAEVVRLDDNHRSSPQVVAAATAALGGSTGPAGLARSTRPDGPAPTVRSYPSEMDEARGVASSLRKRHGPGVAWSQLAVLARTNAQLVIVDRALRAAGIPSRVAGRSLLERPEVAAALADLTGRGDGPLARCLPDLVGLAAAEVDDERRVSIELLGGLGREHLQLDAGATVTGFVAWLDASLRGDRGGDTSASADAVTLSTFHRAKGLEWPVVFLVGLEDGLVPIGRDVDEERRLLYVALTRAQQEVHCSWAARRSFGDRAVTRRPSPWLAAIETSAHPEQVTEAMPDDLRRTRERLRRPARDGVDPTVLAALTEWRRRAARAAQVPTHVVFHDATLAALAVALPTTATELLAVPGLGPVKAARYGETLLALVAKRDRTA